MVIPKIFQSPIHLGRLCFELDSVAGVLVQLRFVKSVSFLNIELYIKWRNLRKKDMIVRSKA